MDFSPEVPEAEEQEDQPEQQGKIKSDEELKAEWYKKTRFTRSTGMV